VNHLEELEVRRRELIERSAVQRRAVMASVEPIVQQAAGFDRATAAVRRYPMLSTALAGAVMVFGSRRLFTLVSRGLALYTLLRKT
jgi:hypothetical protein